MNVDTLPMTAKSNAGTRSNRWIPLTIAALAAIGLLAWSGNNEYRLSVVTLGISYALIAVGMYTPVAWGGSLSLAYGAYAAIGAYSVAVSAKMLGLAVWTGWLLGAAIAVVIALVLSMLTARLNGFYLVAATLFFALAFQSWLSHSLALGASNGIVGVPRLTIFGWEPSNQTLVTIGLLLVITITFFLDRLKFSRWGIIVQSIGESPLMVSASGVSVGKMMVVVLALGAVVSSFGGAFFVSVVGGTTPETFNLNIVFLVLFMIVLGGRSTPWGAVIGAGLTVFLTSVWTVFAGAGGLLILSVAVLIVLLVAPGGILGGIRTLLQQFGSFKTRTKVGQS